MESIFESLENLNVSEACFNDIMDIVEAILSEEDVYEPAAYAKDGYNFMATGGNKLNGKLYKVHTKHDNGVTKTKLYAKDGKEACQLVQKAYGGPDSAHTLANESLYNEIMDITERLFDKILEQPLEKQGSLIYKYHQARNKANAGKDTYTLAKEEEKRKPKEEKGQEKTELRKKYKGQTIEDWKQGRLMDQIAKSAANLGKCKDPATAKAIRRNFHKECFKK